VKRREFITHLGGAAAWPLTARAQQPAMSELGFLDPRSPGTTENLLRAFRQGLKEASYVDGENVATAYRFAEHQFDRLRELAALGALRCGAQNLDAIGGTADIDWPPAPIASDENDPTPTLVAKFCCDAQHSRSVMW
jgi:hypothetical protein